MFGSSVPACGPVETETRTFTAPGRMDPALPVTVRFSGGGLNNSTSGGAPVPPPGRRTMDVVTINDADPLEEDAVTVA